MKNGKTSSSALLNVAAKAADRELTAPQDNPFLAVAATLAGRLLGLFRLYADSAKKGSSKPKTKRGRPALARIARTALLSGSGGTVRCTAHVNLGGPRHG